MTGSDPMPPLDRLRRRVMADPGLQRHLGAIDDVDAFVPAVLEIAAGAGIPLDSATVRMATLPDPIALDRFDNAPAPARSVPGPCWLPAAVVPADAAMAVDWAYFGDVRLTAPFFSDSVRWALRRPISRLMRHRTPLAMLAETPGDPPVPAGLIFHLSRCGSTLVAQMLAAMRQVSVISEPEPLDSVVQLIQANPAVPIGERVRLLRAMVGALGRDRTGAAPHLIFKLDSWHALALPLFRRAFPDTPWIFLYRDPVEILVSHMRLRGLQTVPGAMPGHLYGIAGGELMAAEEYGARVLGRIMAAALDHGDLGGGLLIDYAALPDAVETVILPHFGIAPDAAARAAMAEASGRDAKTPALPFTGDRAEKQREAGARVRAAAAAHLAEPYRRLEARRMSRSRS